MSNINANAPAQSGGYGKSAAAGLAGAGVTVAMLATNQILAAYGHPPISAELAGALQTFVTLLAVFVTPHSAIGG